MLHSLDKSNSNQFIILMDSLQIDTVRAYTFTGSKYIVEIDIILDPNMRLEVNKVNTRDSVLQV